MSRRAFSLSANQIAEMWSIRDSTKVLRGPAPIHRSQWRFYQPLVQRGLMSWGPPPKGFSDSFAGVRVTAKGRAQLRRDDKWAA